MTPIDGQARFDNERHQLREAAHRLLAGIPQRSNGKLTVAALAAEAGISRQPLYEHHPDLVNEFKSTTGRAPIAPNVEALQQQLANSHERIDQLQDYVTVLREHIRTLSAVITELTHEAQAGNVVALPRRRRSEK
jgi:hypothetical protein